MLQVLDNVIQDSFEKMWDQVHGVQKIIGPIIANATDGVNLICYSQGMMAIIWTVHDCDVLLFVSRWANMQRFPRGLSRPQCEDIYIIVQSPGRPVWR